MWTGGKNFPPIMTLKGEAVWTEGNWTKNLST